MSKYCLKPIVLLLTYAATLWLGEANDLNAQNFVEYPGHGLVYGDHTVNSAWLGTETGVTVTFDSDDVTMHQVEGEGLSQRTGLNSLNFVEPAGPENPQTYDHALLVAQYGVRLPLIHQMSGRGTSVVTYAFDSPIDFSVDLFVLDVDTEDIVSITAYDGANNLLDMTQWQFVMDGDLSTYRNNGAVLSDIVAVPPTAVFDTDGISLEATSRENYNRSFSVVRSPPGVDLSRIEVSFTGIHSSFNLVTGGGAHIYLALTTMVLSPSDFNGDGVVNVSDIDSYSGNLGQPASFDPQLDLDEDNDIDLDDLTFHIENYVQTSNGQTGALVGDLDLDGQVDVLTDAFTLVANLGSPGPYSYGLGDLNADRSVDVLGDAFILIGNLGKSNLP